MAAGESTDRGDPDEGLAMPRLRQATPGSWRWPGTAATGRRSDGSRRGLRWPRRSEMAMSTSSGRSRLRGRRWSARQALRVVRRGRSAARPRLAVMGEPPGGREHVTRSDASHRTLPAGGRSRSDRGLDGRGDRCQAARSHGIQRRAWPAPPWHPCHDVGKASPTDRGRSGSKRPVPLRGQLAVSRYDGGLVVVPAAFRAGVDDARDHGPNSEVSAATAASVRADRVVPVGRAVVETTT